MAHKYSDNAGDVIVKEGKAAVRVEKPDRSLANTAGRIFLEQRDPGTGLIVVPSYMRADSFLINLVRGEGSDGFAPIRDGDLASVISRRQAMAENWEIYVTGRESPVNRFKEIASMANDGQGSGAFSSDIVGSLDVVNRGGFMSYMPIDRIELDDFEAFGLRLREFVPEGKSKKRKESLFLLEVDSDRVRDNFGLWALDPEHCYPTGDPRWPFWFEKENKWILIPDDFGNQVIQRIGPPSKRFPGWGQSGTWRYISTFVVDQMIREMEQESLLNEPARGIVWLRGADHPGQLEEVLHEHQRAIDEGDSLFYPGRIFGESISPQAELMVHPWTEAPAGYDPKEWRVFREDALAAAFHMSVSFLRTRVGVGSFVQSGVTNEIQAETGIAWMKSILENVYNRIVRRVTVTVVVPSDRAQKSKYERFNLLADGIQKVQSATDGEALTAEEVRTMIQELGVEITPTSSETRTRRADNRRNQEQEQAYDIDETTGWMTTATLGSWSEDEEE